MENDDSIRIYCLRFGCERETKVVVDVTCYLSGFLAWHG